ncbi:hypothetical protein SLEP1_g42571 [Rubroshorea leprosula]|uniref:Uncharacterized protein n=1 Tax=Rubroshorea leprosula TaxID=152421 RepID=A0AAV5LB90_9ROSI|nr:hypothetical protein SLEP1_g42571 [Rubroshorea leprosula]
MVQIGSLFFSLNIRGPMKTEEKGRNEEMIYPLFFTCQSTKQVLVNKRSPHLLVMNYIRFFPKSMAQDRLIYVISKFTYFTNINLPNLEV